jgi:hypothetical protein
MELRFMNWDKGNIKKKLVWRLGSVRMFPLKYIESNFRSL